VPYSGEYRGPQAFFELLAMMNEGLELTLGATPQYLLAAETVAVRSRLKFTGRASRQSVEMSLVEIYTGSVCGRGAASGVALYARTAFTRRRSGCRER